MLPARQAEFRRAHGRNDRYRPLHHEPRAPQKGLRASATDSGPSQDAPAISDPSADAAISEEILTEMNIHTVRKECRKRRLSTVGLKKDLMQRILTFEAGGAESAGDTSGEDMFPPHIPPGGPLPGKHRFRLEDIKNELRQRGIVPLGNKVELYHQLWAVVDAEGEQADRDQEASSSGQSAHKQPESSNGGAAASAGPGTDAKEQTIAGWPLWELFDPDLDLNKVPNSHMARILKEFGMPCSGNKHALKRRLQPLLNDPDRALAMWSRHAALHIEKQRNALTSQEPGGKGLETSGKERDFQR